MQPFLTKGNTCKFFFQKLTSSLPPNVVLHIFETYWPRPQRPWPLLKWHSVTFGGWSFHMHRHWHALRLHRNSFSRCEKESSSISRNDGGGKRWERARQDQKQPFWTRINGVHGVPQQPEGDKNKMEGIATTEWKTMCAVSPKEHRGYTWLICLSSCPRAYRVHLPAQTHLQITPVTTTSRAQLSPLLNDLCRSIPSELFGVPNQQCSYQPPSHRPILNVWPLGPP